MHWAISGLHKLLQFYRSEFSLLFIVLTITFAIYVALFLYSPKQRAQRSFRGLLQYIFPVEAFRHARIDFSVTMIVKLIWGPLAGKFVAFFAFEATALHLFNSIFGVRAITVSNSWLILLTQFLVYYFTSGFSYYIAHRAMHQNRFLWSIHRVHHSAEALTFLSALRSHPLDSLLAGLWMTFWGGLAAATLSYCTGTAMHPLFPTVLFFWFIFIGVIDMLGHSHVPTSLGPLDYIVPLGKMHRIHHSAELRHRDKNFGNTSSLFDWMFGTIYIPGPDETVQFGLNELELGAQNPHKRLIDIYLEPFTYAWRELRAKSDADKWWSRWRLTPPAEYTEQ